MKVIIMRVSICMYMMMKQVRYYGKKRLEGSTYNTYKMIIYIYIDLVIIFNCPCDRKTKFAIKRLCCIVAGLNM